MGKAGKGVLVVRYDGMILYGMEGASVEMGKMLYGMVLTLDI